MAVPIYDMSRADEIGEVAITTSGGAVTGEVRVTFEDVLTKLEVIDALEKIKGAILEDEAWVGNQ